MDNDSAMTTLELDYLKPSEKGWYLEIAMKVKFYKDLGGKMESSKSYYTQSNIIVDYKTFWPQVFSSYENQIKRLDKYNQIQDFVEFFKQ